MTAYFKCFCGIIAVGCALYCLIKKQYIPPVIVGLYWCGVALYWFFNYIGA